MVLKHMVCWSLQHHLAPGAVPASEQFHTGHSAYQTSPAGRAQDVHFMQHSAPAPATPLLCAWQLHAGQIPGAEMGPTCCAVWVGHVMWVPDYLEQALHYTWYPLQDPCCMQCLQVPHAVQVLKLSGKAVTRCLQHSSQSMCMQSGQGGHHV